MAVNPNTPMEPSAMTALQNLANANASLSGKPYSFPDVSNPHWIAEFRRLQTASSALLKSRLGSYSYAKRSLDTLQYWPQHRPATTGFTARLAAQIDFVYQDTGNAESFDVSIVGNNALNNVANETSFPSLQITITVFGGQSFLMTADVGWNLVKFPTNNTPPFGVLSTSTNLGVAAFTYQDFGGFSTVKFSWSNQTVSPGVYFFRVTVDPALLTSLISQQVNIYGASYTISSTSTIGGIDNAKATKKITGPDTFDNVGGVRQSDTFLNLTTSLTSTTSGYFVAKILPSTYQPAGATTGSAYIQNLHCDYGELTVSCPQSYHWRSLHWEYSNLDTFRDVLDTYGNIQRCVTTGFSGATEPAWSPTLNATTGDGSVVWRSLGQQQLLSRISCVPRWPFIRDIPPLYVIPGGLPASPAGWFIHRIFLHREKTNGPEISVAVGIIRGGSFVSFGNYATGQSYEVFWPIFTSTYMCYQASERVDIQATVVNMVDWSWGSPISYAQNYPIPASAYNFLESILS